MINRNMQEDHFKILLGLQSLMALDILGSKELGNNTNYFFKKQEYGDGILPSMSQNIHEAL